jgi:hypothetical protein
MGLRPGESNPTAEGCFYQEKYPYPFTTDPVKSPANIRETANGIGSFAIKTMAQDCGTRLPLRSRRVNAASYAGGMNGNGVCD